MARGERKHRVERRREAALDVPTPRRALHGERPLNFVPGVAPSLQGWQQALSCRTGLEEIKASNRRRKELRSRGSPSAIAKNSSG